MTDVQAGTNLRVFHYLSDLAVKGETTTYQDMAIALNLPAQGNNMSKVLSPILYNVFMFCVLQKLPHLTSIVVRKSGNEQGLPGMGFWKVIERTQGGAIYHEIAAGSKARKTALSNRFKQEVFTNWGDPLFLQLTLPTLDYPMLDMAEQEEEGFLENLWFERQGAKLERLKPTSRADHETATLSYEQTNAILEEMRQKIAKEFGVTLQDDPNGAWGQAGQRYLTLRFGDSEVSMTINTVASHKADAEHNAFLNEDK